MISCSKQICASKYLLNSALPGRYFLVAELQFHEMILIIPSSKEDGITLFCSSRSLDPFSSEASEASEESKASELRELETWFRSWLWEWVSRTLQPTWLGFGTFSSISRNSGECSSVPFMERFKCWLSEGFFKKSERLEHIFDHFNKFYTTCEVFATLSKTFADCLWYARSGCAAVVINLTSSNINNWSWFDLSESPFVRECGPWIRGLLTDYIYLTVPFLRSEPPWELQCSTNSTPSTTQIPPFLTDSIKTTA